MILAEQILEVFGKLYVEIFRFFFNCMILWINTVESQKFYFKTRFA